MQPTVSILVTLNTIFIIIAIVLVPALLISIIYGFNTKNFSYFKKVLYIGVPILLSFGAAIMLITYQALLK